jgi:hypothetical protein
VPLGNVFLTSNFPILAIYKALNAMIQKALEGRINPKVQLKECIALGENYSRHAITTK